MTFKVSAAVMMLLASPSDARHHLNRDKSLVQKNIKDFGCLPGEFLSADGISCHENINVVQLEKEYPCLPGEYLLADGKTCNPLMFYAQKDI